MLWQLLKRRVIMLYDIVLLMFIGIIWNILLLYYYKRLKISNYVFIKMWLYCDCLKCIKIICTLFLSFVVLFYIDNGY